LSFSLNGKTAIVTGAANGLGLAIARHFLGKGAKVMFADIDEARLHDEMGAEAQTEGGARIFAGDLRQKLTIANLLSATVDAWDRIDILVNASRVITPSEPLSPEADAVEAMLQQNLMTALRLSQHVAKRMIQQASQSEERNAPAGAIINLSSLAAHRVQPGLMGYALASAAVEQMTRSLAVELAPKRIRVNAVAFGSMLSASLQSALKDKAEDRTAILAGTPLGRIAPAAEIAETVQYLASDASSFMTGQVLRLDGGRGLLDCVAIPVH
jgi:7-alpha-hydroxysteroid dehydrogenase